MVERVGLRSGWPGWEGAGRCGRYLGGEGRGLEATGGGYMTGTAVWLGWSCWRRRLAEVGVRSGGHRRVGEVMGRLRLRRTLAVGLTEAIGRRRRSGWVLSAVLMSSE